MTIQALRFQYLIPFGVDIFEIKLKDYRSPILKFTKTFSLFFDKRQKKHLLIP